MSRARRRPGGGRRPGCRITGGDLRGRVLAVPEGTVTRPMRSRVRESLYGVLGSRVVGARLLDVFAGSGAIAVEAISRGAWHADLVEANAGVRRILEDNLRRLQLQARCTVHGEDAYRSLPEGPFRIAFLDPPFADYRAESSRDPWQLAASIAATRLEPGGVVGLECPADGEAPAPPAGLAVALERRYGDTALVLWNKLD